MKPAPKHSESKGDPGACDPIKRGYRTGKYTHILTQGAGVKEQGSEAGVSLSNPCLAIPTPAWKSITCFITQWFSNLSNNVLCLFGQNEKATGAFVGAHLFSSLPV
jgi:hypothetical protein